MMGLLTKAMKTFRSLQILCERGLYDDASALARVLLETTIAIAFILQKKSKQRMLMYHAYPHGRPGYVIDHIVPLACGGADAPSNMQWQTIAERKAKDRTERVGCK
jgi:hypothetical protein